MQPRREITESIDIGIIPLSGIFSEAFQAEFIEGVKASTCPWHSPLY